MLAKHLNSAFFLVLIYKTSIFVVAMERMWYAILWNGNWFFEIHSILHRWSSAIEIMPLKFFSAINKIIQRRRRRRRSSIKFNLLRSTYMRLFISFTLMSMNKIFHLMIHRQNGSFNANNSDIHLTSMVINYEIDWSVSCSCLLTYTHFVSMECQIIRSCDGLNVI